MPAARTPATPKKLVPSAAESGMASKAARIRLSKALAPTLPKPAGAKPKKVKRVSGRYKIPDNEYLQLTALKTRLSLLGVRAKRSELLRAGLMLLVAMDDAQLKRRVAKVAGVETAIPARKPTSSGGAVPEWIAARFTGHKG